MQVLRQDFGDILFKVMAYNLDLTQELQAQIQQNYEAGHYIDLEVSNYRDAVNLLNTLLANDGVTFAHMFLVKLDTEGNIVSGDEIAAVAKELSSEGN